MATDLVELDVLGVRRQLPMDQVVVLLLEQVGHRLLPFVVGFSVGTAIATGHAGVSPPRPMTHDLLVAVLGALGAELARVEIVALEDGVFHAELVLGDGTRVDSRASDAIALAVRARVPVLCAEPVLSESGVIVEDRGTEEEVAEFRNFLEQVEPEDFGAGGPGGEEGLGGAAEPET